MPLDPAEVENSRASFEARLKVEVPSAFLALTAKDGLYKKAYASVVSIESWRAYVFEGKIDGSALAFFVEAQNDLLTSYCLARTGCWRSSLMSLRSALENVLLCVYFKDHLVELSKWPAVRPKGFQELMDYFEKFFPFSGAASVNPYGALSAEYGELSRAVHGSSTSFRMTKDMTVPAIWSSEPASCGMWSTRFQKTLRALNLLLIHAQPNEIQGAKNRPLREAIAMLGLPRASVHSSWNVNLPVV